MAAFGGPGYVVHLSCVEIKERMCLLREVCDGVLQAEHSQQQQRAAAEDRDRREQAVDEIANSLITSTVQEEMALIADTHLR